MKRTADDLHRPAGTAAADGDPVVITPAAAGWDYCGLRVVHLAPDVPRTLELAGDEAAVIVPLSTVDLTAGVDGERFALRGRSDVFARVPDYLYVSRDSTLTLTSAGGGDVALATAPARRRRPIALLRGGRRARGARRRPRQPPGRELPDARGRRRRTASAAARC